jgi:signal peptidase I
VRDPSHPPDDIAGDGAGMGHVPGAVEGARPTTEGGQDSSSGPYGAPGQPRPPGGAYGAPRKGTGPGGNAAPGPAGDVRARSGGNHSAGNGRGLGARPAGALSRADTPPARGLPGSIPDIGPNRPSGPNGSNGPLPGPVDGSGGPPPRRPDDVEDDRRGGRHTRRERKGKPPRSLARTIVEWVAVIGGGIVIALVIEAFFIQAFWIPSPSMVPTLEVGDRVLVNKLAYRWGDVERGDVVVFERPEGLEGNGNPKDLIKRVIAVGGDTIESRNGLVYVNGERVDESGYLEPGTPTDDLPPTEVPEGQVFVMGDNRTNSQDSRVFGAVSEDTIVGRAFVKVLPLSDIGWL